jgi:type IV pilus assembly protein PilB
MIGTNNKGIDEILLESGVLGIEQLKKVWEKQKETNKKIEDVLLEYEFVTKKDILTAQAKMMDFEFVDLSSIKGIDNKVLSAIPENIIKRYRVIPVDVEDGILKVAMKDPLDLFAIDDLRLSTSMQINAVFADVDEINKLISEFFPEITITSAPKSKSKQPENIYDIEDLNDKVIDRINEKVNEKVVIKNETDNLPLPTSNKMSYMEEFKQEPGSFKERIGNFLTKSGVITDEQLNEALKIQLKTGRRIGEILVKEQFITKKLLYEFLEKQLEIEHIDLENINVKEETVKLVNENISRRYTLVPVSKEGFTLRVAMSDPMNIFSLDDLRLATGLEIIPLLADPEQIDAILDKHYEKAVQQRKAVEVKKKFLDLEEEIKKVNQEIAVEIEEDDNGDDALDISDVQNAPIVKMVNIIFNRAVASRASDIHIEPYEDCVVIRYRIDGQLVESMKHERKIHPAMVARIKIISGLNIAEKRIPQDGRISMKIEGQGYDLRVSVLPTMFGEKIVIRLTEKEGFIVSKKDLGLYEDDLNKLDTILSNPHGIVLVTGPTGSGKSTTLYTALKELSKPNVNILTVEDPVEWVVRGVNQVQVNVKAGMTFAAALRAFLRQDPDIIMIGEIRDAETAEIATRAAITGHLVLSTLHTNDAPSSISRIIDMGVEPYMISSSVVGVIAQRLVRRLCNKCKEAYKPGLNEKETLNIKDKENVSLFLPKGCPDCNNTGYKGRIAIYEIMTIDSELREQISKNIPSDKLKECAIKNGMKTLRDNCGRLVKDGVTSIDEMLRVTYTKT